MFWVLFRTALVLSYSLLHSFHLKTRYSLKYLQKLVLIKKNMHENILGSNEVYVSCRVPFVRIYVYIISISFHLQELTIFRSKLDWWWDEFVLLFCVLILHDKTSNDIENNNEEFSRFTYPADISVYCKYDKHIEENLHNLIPFFSSLKLFASLNFCFHNRCWIVCFFEI